MLYRTHKAMGSLAMLVTFQVMQEKGLLAQDLNPYIQLAIMYPASSWGSTAPDLDHHWGSVKEKTPFNMLVHKALHLTHPIHRSWQTHWILLNGGLAYLSYVLVIYGPKIFGTLGLNAFDWTILRLLVVGAAVGVMSHLLADSLTTSGVYLWPSMKFRLVPKSSAFATGGLWETIIFYITLVGCGLALINLILSSQGIMLLAMLK